MSKMFDPVGVTEIVFRLEALGYICLRTTLSQWLYRGQFPEPEGTVSKNPVWNWRTIETWALNTDKIERRATPEEIQDFQRIEAESRKKTA